MRNNMKCRRWQDMARCYITSVMGDPRQHEHSERSLLPHCSLHSPLLLLYHSSHPFAHSLSYPLSTPKAQCLLSLLSGGGAYHANKHFPCFVYSSMTVWFVNDELEMICNKRKLGALHVRFSWKDCERAMESLSKGQPQWRTEGGLGGGGSNPPRNSKGPPKSCQIQPDCENY